MGRVQEKIDTSNPHEEDVLASIKEHASAGVQNW